MNKGKASGLGNTAGQLARLCGQTVMGALCGVGAVWTTTAIWPPSKPFVSHFARQVGAFSTEYPAVLLGLVLGTLCTLLWRALRQ